MEWGCSRHGDDSHVLMESDRLVTRAGLRLKGKSSMVCHGSSSDPEGARYQRALINM